MSYDYFYNQEVEQYIHFQMPTALFEDEKLNKLSINAKFMYCLLFERAKLSFKNGMTDKDGRIYIHYAQSELKELLNCGRTKITDYFNELDGAKGGVGLIERKQKVGVGKSDIIYVKNFARPLTEDIADDLPETGNFSFFHNMENMRFNHYRVPKILFVDENIKEISNISKMIYVFLLNRTTLSRANGWVDDKGRIYIIYPQKELQELIKCSNKTINTAFNELESIHLIERKRQGMNLPNIIYVLDYSTTLKYQKNSEQSVENVESAENIGGEITVNIGDVNSEHREVKNLNIGSVKSEHREVKNLNIGAEKSEHPFIYNNTDNNNINNSHIEVSQSVYPTTPEPIETETTKGQTDGLKNSSMKFSDILTEIGCDLERICFDPESEQDFAEYDEDCRNTNICTIPYRLKANKKAMQQALKFLFAYSYRTKGLEEDNNTKLMDMVIQVLSDMIAQDIAVYDKQTVKYYQIIDKINHIVRTSSLCDWFFSFTQDWKIALDEFCPKNKKAYMKSCIWNSLNEFDFSEACSEMAAEAYCERGSRKRNTSTSSERDNSDGFDPEKYKIFINNI